MSNYHYLCCKKCEISLNLGKKLAIGNSCLVMQGIYSEAERAWINDGRAWLIVQAFLQKHDGHELIFASDEDFPTVQLYDYADGDELLTKTET